jgi:diguanylate cyclase (GGDEF)-like protein
MFKLLRYFTVMSLFSVGVAAALLGLVYRAFAERDMVELTHAYHRELAAMLASNAGFRNELAQSASNAETAHSNLSKLMAADLPLSLLRVQGYDGSGRLIYSSDPQHTGQYPTFAEKRGAVDFSQLISDPTEAGGGIVVSRIPLDSGRVSGMLELHSNVGLKLDKIARTQRELVTSAIVVLGLLYGALLIIVVRADRILKASAVEKKAMDNQLKKLARYEGLTGLSSRLGFRKRMQEALTRAAREKHIVAVLLCELNDARADKQPISETLLDAVAKRLHQNLRRSDALSRMGGSEFAIILNEIASRIEVSEVSEKIVHALGQKFDLEGGSIKLKFWIGISLFPVDATHADMLLRGAELALKYAKQTGKSVAFYQPRKMIPAVEATRAFPLVAKS